MIPNEYFTSINSNDNILLKECVKNSSIIATKYIWEKTKKLINKSHLKYLLIESIGLVKTEQTNFKYINWLLKNDLIKNKDENYCDLLNKCIDTNNLKIFLIIYYHFDFNSSVLNETLVYALLNKKIKFFDRIYEILIYDLQFNKKKYYKLLKQYELGFESFRWIYEKVESVIDINDVKNNIFKYCFNDLEKIKFIESKVNIDYVDLNDYLEMYISNSYFSGITDNPEKFLESFMYIYYKTNLNKIEVQKYFNMIAERKMRNIYIHLKMIGNFLIDEGAEVLDFKSKFYQYYNLKKQIKLKKIRNKNNLYDRKEVENIEKIYI
jgi:hypothetical protein